jgi:hypothetical protein
MLDNLLNLIREHAGNAIVNNPAIPNEQNEAAISAAGSSIMDGFKNLIAQGKTEDLVNLFKQQGGGNLAGQPAVQEITGGFVQNLMNKFGLDHTAASQTANSLIPEVLQKLVHKTNDPGDSSFDIKGILSQVSSGQGGGLDLQGLISKFSSGSGGGILDSIKGLFSK